MAYRWNLLKGDITRLKALFASLENTFRKRIIDHKLLKFDDEFKSLKSYDELLISDDDDKLLKSDDEFKSLKSYDELLISDDDESLISDDDDKLLKSDDEFKSLKSYDELLISDDDESLISDDDDKLLKSDDEFKSLKSYDELLISDDDESLISDDDDKLLKSDDEFKSLKSYDELLISDDDELLISDDDDKSLNDELLKSGDDMLTSNDEFLKIDDDLEIKWFELNKLMDELTEMVDNSEKRYQVDDEEKQDEGGALDDEEKQHERSVLELKKHERIVLELWLEELQEAVFNTEDLVDKIHTEALKHKFDGQVSEKMEDIRRFIESYVKAGDVLGLAEEMWYHQQKDHIYYVDESEEFGMGCDKEEIIKLLLSDDANDKQLSVISIVGNGRIGKTTLARLVYNEQRVSPHFDRKAWVDVPDDFNWVTKSILKFLTLQYEDEEIYDCLDILELDELGFELQNCLQGKRFLLVLDGAKQTPSSKGWEALRYALKDAANGSCIIVTTRNKYIAPMMDAVSTYRMEPLSEDKCWKIFAKLAFVDQNPSSDTQLEVIGKEIVQMCHGLPSSLRILGSLLRFKLQQEEWEAILKRLKPSSDSREDSRENVNVVPNFPKIQGKIPEDLKQCLAYCSIFPQDYEIEKEKLVLLCMAEGFLEPSKKWITMKKVSERIDELKSFFPESSFRMCVNYLAAYVSTRYCFRLEDNHPSQIPLNTRYLSLVGGKYENSVIFEAIDRAKLLRTFLPLDHKSRYLCATEVQNLLSKLQFLRVLSLSHYHITEIPDSIGNLEHLRYIDLSHTPIKRLPESVCELCNLQSLILSNCHSLTELPENTSNLVNLLNLDVSGSGLSEMPRDMDKLRNLQLLPYFVVGKKGGSALKELRNISELCGTLHISKLQNVTYDDGVYIPYLGKMDLLEGLVLEWDDNTADPETARKELAVLIPCTTLERLTINFYCGPKFPDWFGGERQFTKMGFLRLSNCRNCSTLPSLSNLPSLRVLIIECMVAVEEVGPDFSAETSTMNNKELKRLVRKFEVASKSSFSVETYPGMIHKPFKSLERLTFEGMSKWTKWVPFDEFPRLKQLCIRRCPKLRGNLPKVLPLLERVEISESQELVTALTTEASLSNLHYREKIEFVSDDKVPSFTSEGATGSSSLKIEGTEEREDSEQETHLEVETISETNESKLACSTNNWSNPDGPQYLSFKSMKVSGILQLIELPEGLHSLRIEGCDALEKIPEGIMASLKQLQHLYIINCCSLDSLPEDHPPTALKKLYVQNCKKLEIFSPTNRTRQYAFLKHLCIGSSDSLISLPLDFFPKLRSLSIWDCANLQSLSMPVEIQKDLTSLEALEIRDCPKLESFLKGGLSASNLMSIWLSNCKNLKELPDRLNTLMNSLRSLFINNCPEVVSLPKLPSSLSLLSITFCYKLELVMDWGLHSLCNLSRLEIEGGCKNVETFPEDKLLPSNLNSLCIRGLLNLKYLNCKGLQHLIALKTLEISCCNKLQPFPEEDLPSSLSLLCIKECSLLKPKLLNKRKMFD